MEVIQTEKSLPNHIRQRIQYRINCQKPDRVPPFPVRKTRIYIGLISHVKRIYHVRNVSIKNLNPLIQIGARKESKISNVSKLRGQSENYEYSKNPEKIRKVMIEKLFISKETESQKSLNGTSGTIRKVDEENDIVHIQ